MTSEASKYSPVLQGIARGHVVVTGSKRLAREIMLHDADARSAGQTAWVRPAVWPWPEWMRELWHESAWSRPGPTTTRLLNAGRKRVLWESLVRQSGSGGGLVQVHTVARAAVEAWDIACGWGISLDDIAKLATEDAAQFLEWARSYEALCESENLLDESRLPEMLAGLAGKEGQLVLPEAVILAGFDELTPAQDRFVQAIRSAGTEVTRWLPSRKKGKTLVAGAADSQTELTAAARWSLACITANPGATVGVIVPDLAATRVKVNRIFTDILEPATLELNGQRQRSLFSISVGLPLVDQPLVSVALDLVSLADRSPSWSMVSRLLRSGFIGEAITEGNPRAEFDAKFRGEGGIRWPLDRLQQALAKEEDAESRCACPALSRRIRTLLELRRAWPERQTTREWVMDVSHWLDAFGWPGERVLNSDEFQAQQRWRQLLEELAAYEDILGAVTLASFTGALRNLAGQATFKPESSRSPILVLGTLEAAGLEFDHLWVTGLHDGAWPPAPAPTPFLPYKLQRSLMVPRGSSARELSFARAVLSRMVNSADEVRLSWPQAEGDETFRQSPMLDEYSHGEDIPASRLVLEERSGEIFRHRPALEQLQDGIGPSCGEGFAAPGGAYVLELQSLCPFRAFAEIRLGARRLEQPAAGLDPRQRGQLAHDSLHYLWQALKGRDALAHADRAGRHQLVSKAIGRASLRIKTHDNVVLAQSLKIEKSRLAELLEQLLCLELERPDFTVFMTEEQHKLRINSLELKVRPDRVDTIGGEGQFVIDYKTGKVSAASWIGERPRAPQLPLYATALDIKNVRGIAFLQLRAGEIRFVGVCDNEEGFPKGVKWPGKSVLEKQGVADWEALVASWRRILDRLAGEFADGKAGVDPLKSACDFCHLSTFCRIEEKKMTGEVAVDG
ncbi:MAG: hypothetical protein HKN59_10065 [Gammaproteobacteria bacterium]|nr:hypothetical protein [Gammaproteobacteria bacterium]